MRSSKSQVYRVVVNTGIFGGGQEKVEMPNGLDVFRISIQAKLVNPAPYPAFPTGEMGAVISTQSFVNGSANTLRNSWKLILTPINEGTPGNPVFMAPSTTLVLDRRGTDSKATDALYVAAFGPNDQGALFQEMEVIFLFEGYA